MNDELQKKVLGYVFKDKELLMEALTHSSYISENEDVKCYERLEFLGDSILGALISEELYKIAENNPEGELTQMRAFIVCEKGLEEIAKKLSLGNYIKFGTGEKLDKGFAKASILADCLEALVAAVFLDSDFETARTFVLRHFDEQIKLSLEKKMESNYKTILQEKLYKEGNVNIKYVTDYYVGPPHDRKFYVSLFVEGKKIAEGSGRKKKEAEKNAAKAALERML